VGELGAVEILVNNAAHRATFEVIGEISDEKWRTTFDVNIHAMFYLTKAAAFEARKRSSTRPLLPWTCPIKRYFLFYTKGAIQNFTGGLAQMLADKGVRVNAVAPGPIWTPFIPATMPEEPVKNHGKHTPLTSRAAGGTGHGLCDVGRSPHGLKAIHLNASRSLSFFPISIEPFRVVLKRRTRCLTHTLGLLFACRGRP
jgi:NAD(P)-dependent dehydrogenase (short-subunit alcohol dehydrogenase family)